MGRMFAYNHLLHSTTKLCPFEIVYGFIPHVPIDLLAIPPYKKLILMRLIVLN
jgi:hypothetical protein